MKNFLFVAILLLVCSKIFAQTEGELQISVTTSETGGKYAPENVLAIWIENTSGDFIKTLMAYADKRKTHLNNWQESTKNADSEFNLTDAITGATQSSHTTRNCSWDGKNHKGELTDDGAYYICFELSDKNETGNYSKISFDKKNSLSELSPANESSFSAIKIKWIPEGKTNIDQKYKNNVYAVFPSPTNGIIHISGKNILSIEIFNINGAPFFKGRSTSFDLTDQTNGIYFVRLTTPEKTIVKKVIKH